MVDKPTYSEHLDQLVHVLVGSFRIETLQSTTEVL